GPWALAGGAGDRGAEGLAGGIAGGRLTGEKLPVLDGEAASVAVVVAQSERGPALALVDLSSPGVTRSGVESFDPSRSLARLSFRDAPCEALGKPGEGAALVEQLL